MLPSPLRPPASVPSASSTSVATIMSAPHSHASAATSAASTAKPLAGISVGASFNPPQVQPHLHQPFQFQQHHHQQQQYQQQQQDHQYQQPQYQQQQQHPTDAAMPTVSAPSNLSQFDIVRTVGTGSFGRVYLATYLPTQAPCALKVLEKEKVIRLKQVEHTINEKNILQTARHPFIVDLLSSFKDNNNLFMALEYIPGGEVFSHLRRATRYPEPVAAFYASQVILALEFLHARHIAYRDLKPENLLFSHDGYIKLTDFGFAKVVDGVTWTLCGTPEYLAPEIIMMKGYGTAVDWWAVGVFIYEMCAGFPPYYGDPMTVYDKIISNKLRFVSCFSPSLRHILRGLLQSDVTRRLGAMHNGALDIKQHQWFTGLDWDAVVHRSLPAPYIPPISSLMDDSQYDKYDEEPIATASTCKFAEVFEGF